MTLLTCSMYRSQKGLRKPSRATGPVSVNCKYARDVRANLGHVGRFLPLGSPVLVKFVQYCCITLETSRSTALYCTGILKVLAPNVAKTYSTSDACVAPTLSWPWGTRANSNS